MGTIGGATLASCNDPTPSIPTSIDLSHSIYYEYYYSVESRPDFMLYVHTSHTHGQNEKPSVPAPFLELRHDVPVIIPRIGKAQPVVARCQTGTRKITHERPRRWRLLQTPGSLIDRGSSAYLRKRRHVNAPGTRLAALED